MGYGKNLKDALDAKNMSVKELARRAGISPTTLYSVIKRDSAVRFDHALRIAGVLGIDVDLICKNNPYQEETQEILPDMLPNYFGVTDKLNRKTYIENRLGKVKNHASVPAKCSGRYLLSGFGDSIAVIQK